MVGVTVTYTVDCASGVVTASAPLVIAPPLPPFAVPVILGSSGGVTVGSTVSVLVTGAVRLVSVIPPASVVVVVVVVVLAYGGITTALLVALSETGHRVAVVVTGEDTTMTCARLAGQLAICAAHDVIVNAVFVATVSVVSATGQPATPVPVAPAPVAPAPVPVLVVVAVVVAVAVSCPTVIKHVLAAALNSVVDSVGLKSTNCKSPISAPTSTNTPALMLMSAVAGSRQLLPSSGEVVNCSPRVISGMLMKAPARAFASRRGEDGSSSPACTRRRRASVTLAGAEAVSGRRLADAPSLQAGELMFGLETGEELTICRCSQQLDLTGL